MKKNLIKIAMVAVCTSAIMSSCSDAPKEDKKMEDKKMTENKMEEKKAPEPMKEEGVMVGGAMMVKSKNIVENAAGSSDHTTLVAAVTAADLAATLSGPGPFTVFAPTNEAFNKLPKGTVEGLLKPEKKGDLTKVLTYHVVPGSIMASDLKDGMKLKTVQGKEIKVTEKNGVWMVDGAKITIANVVSSNGVTHVIDTVLMP